MQVKGVAVRSVQEYVKEYYLNVFGLWLGRLEPDVTDIYTKRILVSKWYDADKFIRKPTEVLAEILGIKSQKLAWNMGVFSSQTALNGVYKFFLKFGGPEEIIRRIHFFLSTYYNPAELKILLLDTKNRTARIEFIDFADPNDVIVHRILGWSYNTLKQAGAEDAKLSVESVISEKTFIVSLHWA